jgi:serine/threonine protein kinase
MRLGKYQLVRQLAIGGMAEVYLAKAKGIRGFTKRVVLKRILPQYATNEDFIKMFLDEARLAATLDHPNIVHVYDIGSQVGNYYFTMEYVRGEDVRNILKTEHRRGRAVPMGCALSIARGMCAGLHYAHEATDADGSPLGIVHRDVSLSNILVSYDGSVKIVDFGVAKCVAKEAQTVAGTLKGKIAYMSPEQCRGERLDRRSDVFAMGIILYELTTGKRLFTGENEFAILQKIATQDVEPPSTKHADYPEQLERIVLKALRRDRDERYATARDMQRDLEAFAREGRIAMSSIELSEYMHEVFAENIATAPSDTGLSSPSQLAAKAIAPSTRALTPAPRSRPVLVPIDGDADGDDDDASIVVVDATDEPVHTAMFEEAAAIEVGRGAGPAPRRRGRWLAAVATAAIAAAVGFAATHDAREVDLATVPAPVAPAASVPPPVTVDVEPVVRVVAREPEAKPEPNSAARSAAPKPRKSKPKQAKRALSTPTKKSTKQTWDPDSALPPPL